MNNEVPVEEKSVPFIREFYETFCSRGVHLLHGFHDTLTYTIAALQSILKFVVVEQNEKSSIRLSEASISFSEA